MHDTARTHSVTRLGLLHERVYAISAVNMPLSRNRSPPFATCTSYIRSSAPHCRYKIVVQVTIGQMKDQGVRVASRCLWDTATDNYASVHLKNQSLWCSAMVFGVYTE